MSVINADGFVDQDYVANILGFPNTYFVAHQCHLIKSLNEKFSRAQEIISSYLREIPYYKLEVSLMDS